jgi:hypothetical protein
LAKIEECLIIGMNRIEISEELRISNASVGRLLKIRRDGLIESGEAESFRYAIIRELGKQYALTLEEADLQKEKGRHTFMYRDVASGILSKLARISGAEAAAKLKVEHVHKGFASQVSMNGPVQIIVDSNGGQFDPEHGAEGVRMDSPGPDEISSAIG